MLGEKVSKCFVSLGFVLVFGSQLFAQDSASSGQMSGAAQYFLGDRDQILMSINVWGYVRKPGQYVVPRNTDLISLISFAGGPLEGASMGKVTILRAGQLATNGYHAKNGTHRKAPILTVDVKKSLENGEISRIPILQAGDTVMIPESGGSKFKKFLGFRSIWNVIAATATVALIIERVN